MFTTRQIEKLWNLRQYPAVSGMCLTLRPEYAARLLDDLGHSLPAAALAVVRLEELGQAHLPLVADLLRHVLAGQGADGGWGNVAVTAVCLRALLACGGNGVAIDCGLAYLAALQRDDGLWPRVPIRRMPSDFLLSAFVLLELGMFPRFRSAVRFDQAMTLATARIPAGEDDARPLVKNLRTRHRTLVSN
ncbi:MAG: hypothetical protein ACHRHE_17350 [Tepidisphaerales bacterium]